MQLFGRIALVAGLAILPIGVLAQTDPHHPDGNGEHAEPAPVQPSGPMMQMMEGMMAERMATMPEASRAYMGAMMGMHTPMMEAMQEENADVAFVKGMIAHHQAAIDMARTALEFGEDEQSRQWAQEIIDAQQAEIDAMRAWLSDRGE
ncbi:DUF305 domain-containing protein [Pelagibacterium flavum]|mgnify:FL=1|uniref:DUF305 domain-containing protein n=1 Tax=Pelagibacterium flavum TaxID=2984530 RepID=A0ABY6IS31_9HYPH|nr:DUF305 domain-containing protein [Pelagibacterium sp. YIM 151497]UYQ73431.1 DUF305 domain-containing protein [Pelagibacterium sp. YIM 151497]